MTRKRDAVGRASGVHLYMIYQWVEKNKDRLGALKLGYTQTATIASKELKIPVGRKTIAIAAKHFDVKLLEDPPAATPSGDQSAPAKEGTSTFIRVVAVERWIGKAEPTIASLVDRFAKLEEAVLEIQTRPVPVDPSALIREISDKGAAIRKEVGELKDAVIPLLAKLAGMDKLQAEVARLASDVGRLKFNRGLGDAVAHAATPPKNS